MTYRFFTANHPRRQVWLVLCAGCVACQAPTSTTTPAPTTPPTSTTVSSTQFELLQTQVQLLTKSVLDLQEDHQAQQLATQQQLTAMDAQLKALAQSLAKNAELTQQLAAQVSSTVPAPTPTPTAKAPINTVVVGDVFVDRVEASIWVRQDGAAVDCTALQMAVDTAKSAGATIADIYAGHASAWCASHKDAPLCQYRQYGAVPDCSGDVTCNDYPSTFPPSGDATALAYGCPIIGVQPSANMTWFQAALACRASGKHLISNTEWQVAALGTYDPGASSGEGGLCNLKSGKVRLTGLGSQCVSVWGVQDMVGNLDEWVDDWMTAGQAVMQEKEVGHKPWPNYGDGQDVVSNLNGQTFTNDGFVWRSGLPSAPFRGGHYAAGAGGGVYAINLRNGLSDWGQIHGFRCATARTSSEN